METSFHSCSERLIHSIPWIEVLFSSMGREAGEGAGLKGMVN